MSYFTNLIGSSRKSLKRKLRPVPQAAVETLETRSMLTASPLPVLMVIADSQDFYYKEYGDTRQSIEAEGVQVQVAATTLSTSLPHQGTGEPEGTNGAVTPDITLAAVNPDDYSAIVFVGGWGASMYQYAFPGDYINNHYDGDLATKQVINNLINEFIDSDKFVAAICHGTTILDWARRPDGTSPVNGIHMSVPYIGAPAVVYGGFEYGNYGLGQYEQAVANGAIPNTASGQIGDVWTVTDDVQVDGKFITAENYDAALLFGEVIGQQVNAAALEALPPANQAPLANDANWQLTENSPAGFVVGVVTATDSDAGQSLTYAIIGGNVDNAFAIDPDTGEISVANAAAINFEAIPEFQLQVQVTDSADSPLSDTAFVSIQIENVIEPPVAGVLRIADDLIVQGTSSSDTVYVWSGSSASQVCVWMNDVFYGQFAMSGGRVIVYGGDGNDQIFATDARYPVSIFGERGHDMITGGSADDMLDGGEGVDRLCANAGNDLILGGDGDDFLYGLEGDDVLVGGNGNDRLDGDVGRDLLIGGAGSDYLKGGAGEDLLIGGLTDYDQDRTALVALQSVWIGSANPAARRNHLASGVGSNIYLAWNETIHDDGASDVLWGGDDVDLVFAGLAEELYLRVDDLAVHV